MDARKQTQLFSTTLAESKDLLTGTDRVDHQNKNNEIRSETIGSEKEDESVIGQQPRTPTFCSNCGHCMYNQGNKVNRVEESEKPSRFSTGVYYGGGDGPTRKWGSPSKAYVLEEESEKLSLFSTGVYYGGVDGPTRKRDSPSKVNIKQISEDSLNCFIGSGYY